MATDEETLEWRPAQGFCAEVREDGLIRLTVRRGRWPAGHIVKPFTKPGGSTAFVSLTASDGSRPLVPLPEFVARAYLGPAPCPHAIAVYKDGDPNNNHWRNLEWRLDRRFGDESREREWRTILDFPLYEVSDDGLVRKSLAARDRYAGRHLKAWPVDDGYLVVRLYRGDGSAQDISVHRLVATAFLKPSREDQIHVAHRDGNTSNNRADNLRWSTVKENMADRVLHGTAPIGENHARAKLTSKDVREIRRIVPTLRRGGIAKLAEAIGVSAANISNIVAGRTWKHLEDAG